MALRTIRESHVAMHIIDSEIRRNPELEDQYDALKWRIARQPQVGYAMLRNTSPTCKSVITRASARGI